MQEAAKRQGLDGLVLASLTVRAIGLSGRTETTMRIKLIDVATRQTLWTSKMLSSTRVAAAQKTGTDPMAELVTEVLEAVDAYFALTPMPSMKPEHVKGRVARLAEDFSRSDHDAMLPVLAELRYYQAKQLLTAEEATPLYDQILGAGKGRLLAGGDETQRRAVLEEWLE